MGEAIRAVRQAGNRDDRCPDRDLDRSAAACRRRARGADGASERQDRHPRARGRPRGEASDVEIHARDTIALTRRIEELIAQHSGQPLETVSKDMERDYLMSADGAVAYGIIDSVLTHRLA
jgi:hypothetical protein